MRLVGVAAPPAVVHIGVVSLKEKIKTFKITEIIMALAMLRQSMKSLPACLAELGKGGIVLFGG